MPAFRFIKIDKWTGALLRIPNGRQLHNAASNSFGRSRCQTTRSSRIAFLSLRQSSALPRAHAHAVEPATRTMRAHLMRAARTSSRLRWCFLRYSGPFLPSCLFGGGFFGPAAGYFGLANPSSGLFICWMKPNAHTHSQSLCREPGRAAEVRVVYERIERIGFSVRLLAIRAARVPHLRANCKDKVVTQPRFRKAHLLVR